MCDVPSIAVFIIIIIIIIGGGGGGKYILIGGVFASGTQNWTFLS
jgi:hypothetical protein